MICVLYNTLKKEEWHDYRRSGNRVFRRLKEVKIEKTRKYRPPAADWRVLFTGVMVCGFLCNYVRWCGYSVLQEVPEEYKNYLEYRGLHSNCGLEEDTLEYDCEPKKVIDASR